MAAVMESGITRLNEEVDLGVAEPSTNPSLGEEVTTSLAHWQPSLVTAGAVEESLGIYESSEDRFHSSIAYFGQYGGPNEVGSWQTLSLGSEGKLTFF
jgi:hypothetical protein